VLIYEHKSIVGYVVLIFTVMTEECAHTEEITWWI